MTEEGPEENAESPAARPKAFPTKLAVALVVVAVFGGLLAAEAMQPRPDTSGSITATRNDAMADYEAAIKTGKPVYVLFHSLT